VTERVAKPERGGERRGGEGTLHIVLQKHKSGLRYVGSVKGAGKKKKNLNGQFECRIKRINSNTPHFLYYSYYFLKSSG